MHSRRRCCCTGGGPIPCCVCLAQTLTSPWAVLPVGIDANASLALTLDVSFGGTTFTLTNPSPAIGCGWLSPCFFYGGGLTTGYFRWSFAADSFGHHALILSWYGASPCTGVIANQWEYPGDSSSVNPFAWHAVDNNSTGGGDPLYRAGVRNFDISQGSTGLRCYWRPHVAGCTGRPLAGATVELISGGSTFASGVTDAAGNPPPLEYTAYEGQSGVTYRITATGYTTRTGTASCTGAGLPTTFTLSVAAGYCCQVFHATGCNGLDLPGATVNVYDTPGGTLLGTATTDGGGLAYVFWHGSCSAYVTATDAAGRLVAYGSSLAMTSGGTTDVAISTPAAGYHCLSGSCVYPVPDTLHATHPVFGALTFAYSGGSWISTKAYTYPGFGTCPAKTITVTSTWTPSSYTDSWKANAGCPDDTGGTTVTATWTAVTFTCPLSFVESFTHTPTAGAEQNMYQTTGSLSLAVTE